MTFYFSSPAPQNTEYVFHSYSFYYKVVLDPSCNIVDMYATMWLDSLNQLHTVNSHEDHIVLNHNSEKVYNLNTARFTTYSDASCTPFKASFLNTSPFMSMNTAGTRITFDENLIVYSDPTATTETFSYEFKVCSNGDTVCLNPPVYYNRVDIVVHRCDF